MPITKSIMLFYREAFPVFLSVCGLCSNLPTLHVSCPVKIGRVSKVSTKGWLSRTFGPFRLLPLSQKNLSAFYRLDVFLLGVTTLLWLVAKIFTPTFLKRF